jgi:hypothetical protein
VIIPLAPLLRYAKSRNYDERMLAL